VKKILLLSAVLLFSSVLHAQVYTNPVGANLTVQDTGTCTLNQSFLWQHLPINAGTTTVNLAGTFSATLTVRESNNGGATWTSAGTLSSAGTTTYATNGFTDLCVDATTYASGNVSVSISTGLQQVQSVITGSVSPAQIAQFSAGNVNAITASPQCPPVFVAGSQCYFIYADGQDAVAATYNTATTSCGVATVTAGTCVTTGAGDPVFAATDVGKYEFGTSGFLQGALVLPHGTITQFIDTHHVAVSVAANSNIAGTGIFVWGHNDGTALATAFNATLSPNFCNTLNVAAGMILVDQEEFGIPTGDCLNVGSVTNGAGFTSTFVVPVDGFNFTTCGVAVASVCFGYAPTGANGQTTITNMTIWGGGNNLSGVVAAANKVVFGPSFAMYVELLGWGFSQSTMIGYQPAGQNSSGYSIGVDGVGNIACLFIHNAIWIGGNSFCGNSGGVSAEATGANVSVLSVGNLWGPPGGSNTAVYVTNGATFTDVGSNSFSSASINADDYVVGGGTGTSTLNLSGGITATSTTSGSIPIAVLSGGVLSMSKTIINPPASGVGLSVASGGVAYDDCGENTINNSGTYSVSGSYYGDCSITGANAVIASYAITQSGGFGTTAAVTAVTGTPRESQLTITNSGTTQGASPAITFTFPTGAPTGFPIAPICRAFLVGGNDPTYAAGTGRFSTTSTSKTNAVFTYNGTPTVNDTEIVQISCHVQ
jgi:hypothetical protein